jgi:hypothetical protein
MQDKFKTQTLEQDRQQCAWCGAVGKLYEDNLTMLCGLCFARKRGVDAPTFWLLDAGLRQLGVSLGERDKETGNWVYKAHSLEGLHFRMRNIEINIRGIQASVLLPIARLNNDGEVIAELPNGFYDSVLPMFELHCVKDIDAKAMTIADVRRSIAEGEGQRVEFKKSFASSNEAIKTLCAFAHADSGTVFFGVTSDGQIVGVTIGKNTIENFVNEVRQYTTPPLSPLIEIVELEGKTLVLAIIPKASEGQLIYAFDRPYIRVGRSNHVMPPEEQRLRLNRGH